jgi:hypothetical protein
MRGMAQDAFDWLNENAGAVQAIFAGVLVLVTIFSVAFSAVVVRRMREAGTDALRPIVTIAVVGSQYGNLSFVPRVFTCVLRNMGPGPALDITYMPHPNAGDEADIAGSLGPDEDRFLKKAIKADGSDVIHVFYRDVFNNRFSSEIPIKIDDDQNGYTVGEQIIRRL